MDEGKYPGDRQWAMDQATRGIHGGGALDRESKPYAGELHRRAGNGIDAPASPTVTAIADLSRALDQHEKLLSGLADKLQPILRPAADDPRTPSTGSTSPGPLGQSFVVRELFNLQQRLELLAMATGVLIHRLET
jgi:hypothetical protein